MYHCSSCRLLLIVISFFSLSSLHFFLLFTNCLKAEKMYLVVLFYEFIDECLCWRFNEFFHCMAVMSLLIFLNKCGSVYLVFIIRFEMRALSNNPSRSVAANQIFDQAKVQNVSWWVLWMWVSNRQVAKYLFLPWLLWFTLHHWSLNSIKRYWVARVHSNFETVINWIVSRIGSILLPVQMKLIFLRENDADGSLGTPDVA